MKKIILIVLLVMWQLKGFSQVVASDPVLESLMGVSNGLLTSMEAIQNKTDKALSSANWAKNLASIKQLYVLVETTTCTYKNLNLLMNKSGGINNCFISFQYNMQLVNLNAALDVLGLVLTQGFSMSSGERMQQFQSAMQNFQKAHTDMANLKGKLQGRVNVKEQNKIAGTNFSNAYKIKTKL